MPHHTMTNDWDRFIEGEAMDTTREKQREELQRHDPGPLAPLPVPAEVTEAIDSQKRVVDMKLALWESAEKRLVGVRKLLNGAEIEEERARDAKNLAEGRLLMLELQRKRCEQGIEPNLFYVRGEE